MLDQIAGNMAALGLGDHSLLNQFAGCRADGDRRPVKVGVWRVYQERRQVPLCDQVFTRRPENHAVGHAIRVAPQAAPVRPSRGGGQQ